MIRAAFTPMPVTRRKFMIGTAATSAVAGISVLSHRAFAATDFYRFRHGAFDITVLSDGFLTLPVEILLPDASNTERLAILQMMGGDAQSAPVQTNIPLIRYGDDLILIDTGSGGNFQPSAGMLEHNLATIGISPNDITKVVFTHAHPDHSGATVTADGNVRYPNADYFISEAEWMFWTDRNFETRMPKALHGFATGAKRDLLPIRDRLNLVRPGDEIVPGMQVIDTKGHTPGHISLELAGDDKLLITGDACTNDIIFFTHPAWHFGFDTDPEQALANRQMLLDRAASEKIKMLGYHWTYPGVGHAERHGNAYRFVRA